MVIDRTPRNTEDINRPGQLGDMEDELDTLEDDLKAMEDN